MPTLYFTKYGTPKAKNQWRDFVSWVYIADTTTLPLRFISLLHRFTTLSPIMSYVFPVAPGTIPPLISRVDLLKYRPSCTQGTPYHRFLIYHVIGIGRHGLSLHLKKVETIHPIVG